MAKSKKTSTRGNRGTYAINPPKSKEAKENWKRCNTKDGQAGKITKVIDMRKINNKLTE